jgi:hypothetical protein
MPLARRHLDGVNSIQTARSSLSMLIRTRKLVEEPVRRRAEALLVLLTDCEVSENCPSSNLRVDRSTSLGDSWATEELEK